MNVLEGLDWIDACCVCHGMPGISTWWLESIRKWYQGGQQKGIYRVGRRGGKSSTLCRLAVAEALFGNHFVAPGDTPIIPLIAQNRDRASELLTYVRAILLACEKKEKEDFRANASEICLTANRVTFKVFAASIAGVSGFTSIFGLCDEVAKWRDADTGANPATEVIASLMPTFATVPGARLVLSSSPLGSLDAHAKAFSRGITGGQYVDFASTWVAHPEITEEKTHELEPNEAYWSREYAALPTEGDSLSMFSPHLLDMATRAESVVPCEPGVTYVGAMDPGYVRNPWTYGLFGCRYVGKEIKRSMVLAKEWQGSHSRPNDPEAIFSEISTIHKSYRGSVGVYTDQYEHFALQRIALKYELPVSVGERGNQLARFESLSTLLASGQVELPASPQIRSDLLSVQMKVTPNGFTIGLPETPDGRHADSAPMIALGISKCTVDPDPRFVVMSLEQREMVSLAEEYRKAKLHKDPWGRTEETF